jgi:transposase
MKEYYDSDISREQFELIREDLEKAKKKTRPRTVDIYAVFCAVLYILKTGCQWRMLPVNFPNWKLVYYYFTVWKNREDDKSESILDKVLKKIGAKTSKTK